MPIRLSRPRNRMIHAPSQLHAYYTITLQGLFGYPLTHAQHILHNLILPYQPSPRLVPTPDPARLSLLLPPGTQTTTLSIIWDRCLFLVDDAGQILGVGLSHAKNTSPT